jgi:V/A-type H+-transporting ATPase subunit F
MKFERIAVIGERAITIGFKLIGIKDIFIAEGRDGVHKFMELMNEKRFNLIMVSEGIKLHMDKTQLRYAETSISPLVVFIPLPGVEEEKESVESLAKRILGVDISKLGVAK